MINENLIDSTGEIRETICDMTGAATASAIIRWLAVVMVVRSKLMDKLRALNIHRVRDQFCLLFAAARECLSCANRTPSRVLCPYNLSLTRVYHTCGSHCDHGDIMGIIIMCMCVVVCRMNARKFPQTQHNTHTTNDQITSRPEGDTRDRKKTAHNLCAYYIHTNHIAIWIGPRQSSNSIVHIHNMHTKKWCVYVRTRS